MGLVKITSPQNTQPNIPLEAEIIATFPIVMDFLLGVPIYGNIGTIVLQVQLQVATDEAFSSIVWSSSIPTRWYNPGSDSATGWYVAAAREVINNGNLQSQTHTFKAPPGFLKSGLTYYCRFILDTVAAWFTDDAANTGDRKSGIVDSDSPVFSFSTINNLPIISFSADPTTLPEFGGKVTLSWIVTNPPGGQFLNVFIKPETLAGLGHVPDQGSATVEIEETTQFTLEATNVNPGKSIANIVVPVSAPTGIIPYFVDKVPFSISQIQDSGLKLAKIGQSVDLQLYTEFMSDIHLFVAYPWATLQSSVLKMDVTPPDLMKNLIDESTQTVTFTIPNPNHPESLTANTAVSGAWGYDAKGKDGKTLRQVSGYFILMGE